MGTCVGRRRRFLWVRPPAFNVHTASSSLPCSQLLKAVTEVTGTWAEAMEMVKQQQGEQIFWGSSSGMSLGMWSPPLWSGPGLSQCALA